MTVHGRYTGAVGFVVANDRVVGNDSTDVSQKGTGPVLNKIVGFARALG